MFIGYQLRKVGEDIKTVEGEDGTLITIVTDITEPFISHIAETKEELENMPCVTLDKIEETDVEYILHNGEYKTKTEVDAEVKKEETEARIAELKQQLSYSDYVVIKIAEGEATTEEYDDVLAARKRWRTEINELEKTI